MASKTHIVYFEPVCDLATVFKSQEKAEAAAAEYEKTHGYTMEAVFCGRQHTRRNGAGAGVGWHVRGKYFH